MRRQKWFLKYIIATTLVVAIGVVLIKAADAGGPDGNTGSPARMYSGQ